MSNEGAAVENFCVWSFVCSISFLYSLDLFGFSVYISVYISDKPSTSLCCRT